MFTRQPHAGNPSCRWVAPPRALPRRPTRRERAAQIDAPADFARAAEIVRVVLGERDVA